MYMVIASSVAANVTKMTTATITNCTEGSSPGAAVMDEDLIIES